MAFPEHFKKPPIFPSEEANRIRSRRKPRRPFSGRTGPWLGSCNRLSGLMSLPALWPGLACELTPGLWRHPTERGTAVRVACNLLLINGCLTVCDEQNSGPGSPRMVTVLMLLLVTRESHLIAPVSQNSVTRSVTFY